MAIHEAGHVINAWLTDGRVAEIRVPLIGFSETRFSKNQYPCFVAWGGVAWGSLLPLLAWGYAQRIKLIRPAAAFFAGMCCVINGTYLGVGWIWRVGDGGDLLRCGTPRWVMSATGTVIASLGFWIWHRIGTRDRFTDV